VLAAILVAAGEVVDVGTPIATIDEGAGAAAGAAEDAGRGVAAAAPEGPPLSPVVRRLAAEHGLDLAALAGSGRQGRITARDVRAALAARGGAAPEARPAPATAADEVLPFNARRRVTAEHMVRSKATSPHVLQAVEVDYAAVERARTAHGAAWKAQHGYALTYLPFIARAVCLALAEFPRLHARVDGARLVVSRAVHLGIAVDLDHDGLVAPVIRDAQGLSVHGLAAAIRRLSEAARANRLGPDDYAGGTYTLSNSGSFDTLFTAPIINQPQVAILSTDGIRKRPVVVDDGHGDAIAIRPVGILAQSFDHRALDGAYSAAFLRRLRELLEGRAWHALMDAADA
jgi:2-oxoglutarate dehydrogenase E2 component (dihydrolipoamide succinyltransferase)